MTDRKVSVNWKQIARTLRDHTQDYEGCPNHWCADDHAGVLTEWPCPDWIRASAALDD